MAQGKEHIPSEESRNLVEKASGFGVPHKDICALVGLSDRETLTKHYDKELAEGKAKANIRVGNTLFQRAVDGDTTAAIWWSKTQMGWKETNVTEHTGSLELKEIRMVVVDPK